MNNPISNEPVEVPTMPDGAPVQVTQVSFTRKFNLGNYESMDVSMTATVGPGQDPLDVTEALDRFTRTYRKNMSPWSSK